MLLKFRLIYCSLLLTKWLSIYFKRYIYVLLQIRKNWRGIRKFILSATYIFSVKSYICILHIICWNIHCFIIIFHFENVVNFISLCIIKILFNIFFVKIINLSHFFNNAWTLVIWFNFYFFSIFNKSSVEKRKNFLTQRNNFF